MAGIYTVELMPCGPKSTLLKGAGIQVAAVLTVLLSGQRVVTNAAESAVRLPRFKSLFQHFLHVLLWACNLPF